MSILSYFPSDCDSQLPEQPLLLRPGSAMRGLGDLRTIARRDSFPTVSSIATYSRGDML